MGIRIFGYELDEIRKAVVAFVGNASAIAVVAVDSLADENLSTVGGIVAALIELATVYGVYDATNARSSAARRL
jgi:hypothetical protein